MRFLKDFFSRFQQDDAPRMAACLAFYTLFAVAPLLLLVMTFASFLGLERQIAVIYQIRLLVGPEAAEAARMILHAVSSRAELTSLVGLTSAVVWMFSASLLFGELRVALTKIFGGPAKPNPSRGIFHDILHYCKSRLVSLALVLAFTFVALASLMISSYLAFYMRQHAGGLFELFHVLISFSLHFVFFAGAYRYVPAVKVSMRRAIWGGLMTAALFVVGNELIGFYLGKMAPGSVYGAAGSLVVLLFWVYYSSLIIFAGAQLTTMIVPDRPRSLRQASVDL